MLALKISSKSVSSSPAFLFLSRKMRATEAEQEEIQGVKIHFRVIYYCMIS